MTIPLDQVAGPFGALVVMALLVGALAKVIAVLWADHQRSDQEDRAERDRAVALVEAMVPTLKDLAAAQHEANRRAAGSHRKDDGAT